MLRRIAALFWWLGLSLWFGGLVALGAVAAPPIFHTIRDVNATLPGTPEWLNAQDQLGGEIFGEILRRFSILEGVCLAALLAALFISLLMRRNLWLWIRLFMVLALGSLLYYDSRVLTPEVWKTRTLTRGVQSAELENRFQVLHKRAEFLGQIKVWILVGLVGVSASTSNPSRKLQGEQPSHD